MIHIEYLICIHSTPSGRLNPPISSDPSWKISRFLATSGYWHPFTWCISQIPHWWNFNSAKNPNFHVKTSCAFSETAAFDAKIVTFKYLLTFAKIVIAFPKKTHVWLCFFLHLCSKRTPKRVCLNTGYYHSIPNSTAWSIIDSSHDNFGANPPCYCWRNILTRSPSS